MATRIGNLTVLAASLGICCTAMTADAVIARYDAGHSPDSPSSPVDFGFTELGVTPANGSTAEAVSNDIGGLNAWHVVDSSTLDRPHYETALSSEDIQSMADNGWVLNAVVRSAGFSSNVLWGVADDTQFGGPGNGQRWGIGFHNPGNVNLYINAAGGISTLVTSDGTGSALYYDVMVIGRPHSLTASFYINGSMITDSYTGQDNSGDAGKIEFAASPSTAGVGMDAYWNLMVLSVLQPGDANNDGMVNLSDLQILGDNWQSTTADWTTADFNWDGEVNLADLQILGDNWGAGTTPDISFDEALAAVTIPEPAAAGLLGMGGLLILWRRVLRD